MDVITLFILIILAPITAAIGQKSMISGTVHNAKNGKPLAGANIFLDNTTIGTQTNSKGTFRLKNIPEGTFNVIITYVGFQEDEIKLSFPDAQKKRLNIALKLKVYKLGKLTVTGNNKKWLRELKKFKKYFLGPTKNAKKTIIINPQVLRFKRVNGKFIAVAVKPLKIKNKALGYHIKYYLQEMVVRNGTILTDGHAKYTPINPKNRRQRNHWQMKRQQVYNGSFRQFIQALISGLLNKEGFKIWFTNKNYEGSQLSKVRANQLYIYSQLNKIIFFFYKNYKYLRVDYLKRHLTRRMARLTHLNKNGHQVSWIKLPKGKAIINIQTGHQIGPYRVILSGYWAFTTRVPNLLPDNYHLDKDNDYYSH
jgi:hypothetical protein